jgi:hypothetical protein
MQPTSQHLIQSLQARYPGTQDPSAQKAWQDAVYRAANNVDDIGREVFLYLCFSVRGRSSGNA